MSEPASKLSAILIVAALGGALGLVAFPADADPVELPCDPADCPPVDPCELAPERCNPPEDGPIESDE